MPKAIESLGLLRIQVEDGQPHSVEEALQMVIDFLVEIGQTENPRAARYAAIAAAVSISLGEFAGAFNKAGSPLVSELCHKLRPKTFNGIIRMSDFHIEPSEAGD